MNLAVLPLTVLWSARMPVTGLPLAALPLAVPLPTKMPVSPLKLAVLPLMDGGGRHALGKVANDDQVDWSPALKLFTGDVAYVWHAGVHAAEVTANLHNIGFQIT